MNSQGLTEDFNMSIEWFLSMNLSFHKFYKKYIFLKIHDFLDFCMFFIIF